MNKFWSQRCSVPEDIVDFLFAIFDIYETRARVGTYNKLDFEVKTKEQGHNRAHIHASFDNKYEVSISIDDKIEIIAGKLPNKQETIAISWVKDNIDMLRSKWSDYHFEIPGLISGIDKKELEEIH